MFPNSHRTWMNGTMNTVRRFAWIALFAVLTVFSIPWTQWGAGRVYAGIPSWVWWHGLWMILVSVCFYGFTRRAWDEFIEGSSDE